MNAEKMLIVSVILLSGCDDYPNCTFEPWRETPGRHPTATRSPLHLWENDETRPIYEVRVQDSHGYAIHTTRAVRPAMSGDLEYWDYTWHRWMKANAVPDSNAQWREILLQPLPDATSTITLEPMFLLPDYLGGGERRP